MSEDRHHQHPSQRRSSQYDRGAPRAAAALPTRQHDGTDREALGDLVQKHREKDQPTKPIRNQESGRDGDPVEESMNHESKQYRVGIMRVNELVVMRFFAEVEVWRDRVLKKVNDKVTHQHKERRRFSSHFDTLGNHLHQRRGEHESRAQRDEVAQVAPLPMPLDNDRAPEDVSGSGRETQEDAGEDRVHEERVPSPGTEKSL